VTRCAREKVAQNVAQSIYCEIKYATKKWPNYLCYLCIFNKNNPK
jgi:hypothetical protein